MQVSWVSYETAAESLRGVIAGAKGDDPLAPVTVVVPSNHVGVASRRRLASGALGPVCGRGTGLIAVDFLTVYRLAELYGAPALAGSGRRPVSTPVVAAALRGALAADAGVFAPVAEHPATEMALVQAYRELRDLPDDDLAAVAGRSRRAGDVVRLCRAARTALVGGWYDEEDLIDSAAAALDADPHDGAATELGTIVVYLPQQLSLHGGRLLRTLARRHQVVVLAGTTGDAGADTEVVTSVARLGIDQDPGSGADSPVPIPIDERRTRIVVVSDADEEVRVAVRAVVDAVRHGTRLDRIAVLYASPDPYGRLVHEQLAAAGVKTNGAAVVPLTARAAGRSLLQLFALAQNGFRRPDVFAWLAGAPLRHQRRRIPVTAWEQLSRDAAVFSGRRQWDTRLARLADELEEDAAAGRDADRPAWRRERAQVDAERARDLRAFVLELIDDLAGAAGEVRRWAEHARWARALLDRLLGGSPEQASWPPVERAAADRVDAALDRLAALDGVEGPVSLDTFARTLELELDADLGRVGRLGDGVLVGGVGLGVALDLDVVVVLGLAEGTFPTLVHDDSLLPDDERQAVAGRLPLRREGVERQHRQLLGALAGAGRQVLCVPRGDLRRSSDRMPSRWVLDAASTLAARRVRSHQLLTMQAPWLEQVASFDAGLRRVAFPATDQEYRLAELLAVPAPDRRASALAGSADEPLAAGARMVAARRSTRFTRYDGNLAGQPIPSPTEGVTSPTRLENWAGCPFSYLIGDLLGVRPLDHPEDELRITPIDRGELVHAALERFIAEVLDRPVAAQPGPDEAWGADDRRRMRAIGEELCADYEARGRTGRAVYWPRDRGRILRDLDEFLDRDSAYRRAQRTRPIAVELPFGFAGSAVAAPALRLPDGRCVRFRGKGDRVDQVDGGALLIIDYKTGKPDRYRSLNEDNPDEGGRRLQLPVYALAARVHAARPDAPVYATVLVRHRQGRFHAHRLRRHRRPPGPGGKDGGHHGRRDRGGRVPGAPHRGEHLAVGRLRVLRHGRPRRQ